MSRIYHRLDGLVPRSRIEAIIESLPSDLRTALLMDDAGWQSEEIGTALRVSSLEARVRVLRARAEFRKRLMELPLNVRDLPAVEGVDEFEMMQRLCQEHDQAAAMRGFYGL